ncbi:MAG: ribonuclease P protein component [Bacteroidales bacterium]|nr:ribonuclease P protein component [Bacteroidales bacterium]
MKHSLSPEYNCKLTKQERLIYKKEVDFLFKKGVSFFYYPFQVFAFQNKDIFDPGVKVLFSVSKKKFKKAIDRNVLKRKMREAYRLNKHQLKNHKSDQLVVAIIYSGGKVLDYKHIEIKIQMINKRLLLLSGNEIPFFKSEKK